MSFLDLTLKTEYRSLREDVAKDFLNPVLKQSILYRRAVGYFSSSGLMALSEGIFSLTEKGGTIQLIISPQLSEEDLFAIKDGIYRRGKVTAEEFINHCGDFDKPRCNFLSNLIATGRLAIKMAFIEESGGLGRFNEKMGILYDADGNIIAFSGSMNESANAFTKNFDSIDIFTSWTVDADRVKAKAAVFDSLWNNRELGVSVLDFDAAKVKSVRYDEMSKIKTPEELSTVRATTYAKTIREKSIRRQIVDLSKELANDATNDTKTLEDLVAKAGQITTCLTTSTNDEPWFYAKDLSIQAYDNAIARGKVQGLQGIRTGLHNLDEMTGGLKKSDLIILAARPSMGKSALALNIALAAARDVPVLVFSLEMSKAQLVDRLISSVSGVNLKRILGGGLSKDEMSRILDVSPEMEKRKLSIDDTGGLRISELKMRARQFKHKQGLGLIVIDYLQLIRGSKADRVQEVSEVSRELKALAKELDVPVLALSQLSRNLEMRTDRRPRLSDLRESGSIEQDADIVMFLYRDEYYNRTEENKNIAEIIMAKNRNGATGDRKFRFVPECVCFYDLTRREN